MSTFLNMVPINLLEQIKTAKLAEGRASWMWRVNTDVVRPRKDECLSPVNWVEPEKTKKSARMSAFINMVPKAGQHPLVFTSTPETHVKIMRKLPIASRGAISTDQE